MRSVIVLFAIAVLTALAVTRAQDSASATHATRIVVAPGSDPDETGPLRGASVGERSTISVQTGPEVKRVAYFVDDLEAARRPVATRTRAPFALDWESKGGRAAFAPGRHLLVARLDYRDGSTRIARAAYTIVRFHLSPGGSDSNPCTREEPCRSFRRGYSGARAGQVVEAAGGSYGCEDGISGDRGAEVVIRSAEGAVASTDCSFEIRATGLRLERVSVSGTVTFLPGADRSSFANGWANGFNIYGADDVTISGSTFDGHGQVSNNKIWDQPAGSTPDRFRILGNTIRNFYGPTDADHSEGIFVGYSTDGLIEGNTFDNNGNTAHVFFSYWSARADASSSFPQNVCVRRNRFGPTHGAYFAVAFRQEIPQSAGISIAPSPLNTVSRGLGLSSSRSMVRAC